MTRSDIFYMLITAGLFGLLFVLAEVLHTKASLPAEATRKLTHIGTGLLAVRFLGFRYVWEAGVLCGLFFLILIWSKRKRALSSINGIERESAGSTLYPVSVFLIFLLYRWMGWTPFYYLTPILVLALCDPAAAFAGRRYKRYMHISGEKKTFAGSLAFVLVGIAVLLAVHLISPAWTILPLIALLPAAVLAAIAERLSKNGWDNLTVPLSMAAYFVLALLIHTGPSHP